MPFPALCQSELRQQLALCDVHPAAAAAHTPPPSALIDIPGISSISAVLCCVVLCCVVLCCVVLCCVVLCCVVLCCVVLCCVVLCCVVLSWLLFLVTVTFFQILLLGRRVSIFYRHPHNLSARFARPACRSFSICKLLRDHSIEETSYCSKEFIKQVGSAACRLTMHYDVWPSQLRVSSGCSHVPGKSVACVNVARKPRRIKQVAASITPHHFPPQHQLRRQL
jgi:hypothetical protein